MSKVKLTDKRRRLNCATSAMKAYHANDCVDSSEDCQFIDLFADLLHLARSIGVDGEDCFRIGRDHYLVEVREEVD
jgi:hypothetical protein